MVAEWYIVPFAQIIGSFPHSEGDVSRNERRNLRAELFLLAVYLMVLFQ
jgi:hypothetical protein